MTTRNQKRKAAVMGSEEIDNHVSQEVVHVQSIELGESSRKVIRTFYRASHHI